MPATSITRYIHGPIISSSDLDAHEALFRAFGLVTLSRTSLDETACLDQWGLKGSRATELLMQTPGTRYGVRLIRFDPLSDVVVRDRRRGYDTDAPKVIDFYAPDFDSACDALARAGWPVHRPIAEYNLPEGRFRETHIWGPDEIVCAVISGPAAFFEEFASVRDRLFSEPQSLSGPVSRTDQSEDFFARVLGLDVIYRYDINDTSFRDMVGIDDDAFQLRAMNIGLDTREPYLALIHYGLKPGALASLQGRAVPPNRGTLGATLIVNDAAHVASTVQTAGGQIIALLSHLQVALLGECRGVLFGAPNGGCYQALEPLTGTQRK